MKITNELQRFPDFLGMNFNAYSKIAWLQIVKKEAYGFLTRKNTLKSQKSSNLILLGASSRCPKEMTPETLILSSDPQRLKHVFKKKK